MKLSLLLVTAPALATLTSLTETVDRLLLVNTLGAPINNVSSGILAVVDTYAYANRSTVSINYDLLALVDNENEDAELGLDIPLHERGLRGIAERTKAIINNLHKYASAPSHGFSNLAVKIGVDVVKQVAKSLSDYFLASQGKGRGNTAYCSTKCIQHTLAGHKYDICAFMYVPETDECRFSGTNDLESTILNAFSTDAGSGTVARCFSFVHKNVVLYVKYSQADSGITMQQITCESVNNSTPP